jgi:hypothetical protein
MICRRSLLTAAMAAALLGGMSSARADDQVSLTIGKLESIRISGVSGDGEAERQ